MADKRPKFLHDESRQQTESENGFHFWLTVAGLTVFIFMLFYSQKIHGQM